jgi:cellobiose phosphorylase/cellobionic acid phosphorylase
VSIKKKEESAAACTWRWNSDGDLVIEDPVVGNDWWNYLFNDDAQLKVSPFGQGMSWSRHPRIQPWGRGQRGLWIRFEDGTVWCPSGWPVRDPEAEWHCIHSPFATRIVGKRRGLEVEWRVFIPVQGQREIWTVRLRNTGREAVSFSMTHALYLPASGYMGSRSFWDPERGMLLRHDFPHHAAYDDYESLSKMANWLFVCPTREPTGYALSDEDLWGSQPPGNAPEGVVRGLPSRPAYLKPSCASLQYDLTVEAGELASVSFVAGAAVTTDAAAEACADLRAEADIEFAYAQVKAAWRATEARLQVNTPDPQINRYINRWGKKELIWMARLWRNGISTPWRNELQDAMGYSLVDPDAARPFLDAVTSAQERSGYLKVWNTRAGEKPNHPLVHFKHNDGGIWLLITRSVAAKHAGGPEELLREIPWSDGSQAPLIDHLEAAMEHSFADRNAQGLVRMWDGDWTDPMNGPGRGGEGGSAWSNFALAYGCRLLAPLAEALGRTALSRRCQEIHRELGEAVRTHLWCGRWFAYGLDDAGRRFGDEVDGRIWLNPQSWALLSGIATPQEARSIRQSVDERLMTPYGPLLFDPPYEGWDPVVGRLSLKVPGSTENASIYCHAAAFWAAGLAEIGEREAALAVIKKVIPDDPEHTPEESGQVPIWQHNAWFGLRDSHSFGRSSGTLGTGTVPWVFFIVLEQLLGEERSSGTGNPGSRTFI